MIFFFGQSKMLKIIFGLIEIAIGRHFLCRRNSEIYSFWIIPQYMVCCAQWDKRSCRRTWCYYWIVIVELKNFKLITFCWNVFWLSIDLSIYILLFLKPFSANLLEICNRFMILFRISGALEFMNDIKDLKF